MTMQLRNSSGQECTKYMPRTEHLMHRFKLFRGVSLDINRLDHGFGILVAQRSRVKFTLID